MLRGHAVYGTQMMFDVMVQPPVFRCGLRKLTAVFGLHRKLTDDLFLNAADEPAKKQEIVSIVQKKYRGRSGRIREKAGNREHWPEENPQEERTNQRKNRKS